MGGKASLLARGDRGRAGVRWVQIFGDEKRALLSLDRRRMSQVGVGNFQDAGLHQPGVQKQRMVQQHFCGGIHCLKSK